MRNPRGDSHNAPGAGKCIRQEGRITAHERVRTLKRDDGHVTVRIPDIARAVAAEGRFLGKVGAETPSVARSDPIDRLKGQTTPRRRHQKAQDAAVVPLNTVLVVASMAMRLTCGYRRIVALSVIVMLSDDGSPCIAKQTQIFGRQIGLKLCFTLVRTSEAFGKTPKRGHGHFTPLPDPRTVAPGIRQAAPMPLPEAHSCRGHRSAQAFRNVRKVCTLVVRCRSTWVTSQSWLLHSGRGGKTMTVSSQPCSAQVVENPMPSPARTAGRAAVIWLT